jgi:hypothetical protein
LATKYETGGNCDAWCTKCKMDLAHTIHALVDGAPVKVECNTCHGIHKYRPTQAEKDAKKTKKASSSSRKRAEPKIAPALVRWREAMGRLGDSGSHAYSVKALFEVDHVLDHPKFGVGVVVKILEPTRARVLFQDDERTMVMGLGR